MKAIVFLFAFFAVACSFQQEATSQSNFETKRSVSTVTDKGMPKTIVRSGAKWNFGLGALQTYRASQSAEFWDADRQGTVARRNCHKEVGNVHRWQQDKVISVIEQRGSKLSIIDFATDLNKEPE